MKKVLEKLQPMSGYHSATNSIRKIFNYHGYTINEEMIFGLSSALDFYYLENRTSQIPHIYGRIKPGEFEANLSDSLNVKIKTRETASKKKAMEELKALIDKGEPVIVYVDVAYLPYLKIPDYYHFGAHSIIVFGYDDEQEIFFVSDRDTKGFHITMSSQEMPDDYHIISYDNLILARSSKEKNQPPKNRWLQFDFNGLNDINIDIIKKAIDKNISNMMNNTLKNVGVGGIEHFSQKVRDWNNLSEEILHRSSYESFTMINKVGSTGGGCYRKIYGNFLRNAGDKFDDEFLYKCGVEFNKTADIWDEVADGFYKIFNTLDRTPISNISNKLLTISLRERELLLRIKEYLNGN